MIYKAEKGHCIVHSFYHILTVQRHKKYWLPFYIQYSIYPGQFNNFDAPGYFIE